MLAPQASGVFAMALALSLQVDGTDPFLHSSGGRVTWVGQPEGSVPFGAKYAPEGQKMGLPFWMMYVACAEQPDGKTPKMQVTLLPSLGFVDEVPPDRLGCCGQPD